MKENKNSFAVIMTTFSDLANNPMADPSEYADALTAFGTACARSVLKKVIDPKAKEKTDSGKYILADRLTDSGFNPLLTRMQLDLARDQKDLERLVYANNNATDLFFNSYGDLEEETVDSDLAQAAAALARENLADGLDLAQDAICAILDEMQKQKERDPEKPVDFERVYSVRRLKRKVLIKEADSVNGYETVETSPIREVYKAIRRAIQTSRAIQTDPRNGYSYLEDFVTDENGEKTEIYRRLPKYADLGGTVRDFNGGETAYTVDRETVDVYNDVLSRLNLSDRQRVILQYRMQGYGYQAIATKLGIKKQVVLIQMQRVQEKAEKIGFTPSLWNEMTAND